MGRGRGKSKKQNVVTAQDDLGSSEEQKVPVSKRKARTQKQLKDEVEGDAMVEKLGTDGENAKSTITSKSVNDETSEENDSKKRKGFPQVNENSDPGREEDGSEVKTESPIKSAGFRQSGSRRKSTPRRAAEVGVEC